MDNMIFRQRKFTLAVVFTTATIIGLFLSFLTGGEFLMGMGAILGLYGAANVTEKYNAG